MGRLGYCPGCQARYQARRDASDRLAAEVRITNGDLFRGLSEFDARRLAEHLVGRARLGRGALMAGIADYLAETRERRSIVCPAWRISAPPARARLRGDR